jgi:hypothetical protein
MDLIQYNDLVRVYGDVLEYNTSRWFWSYFSQGGLRAYITYKTRAYVEENCPQRLILTGSPNESFLDHSVYDYNALYRYPVEHWLENTFTEAANIDSSIGFRFMWYLEEVYGDYTRWLTEYEKSKPSPRYFSTLSVSKEIQAYKKAYGDDVFDGFYPWLKERESFFDDVNSRQSMDLTNVEIIRPFPKCIFQDTLWNVNCTAGGIVDLRYNNMWVDIETGRQYLNVYKGLGTDGMILSLDCSTAVELYDSEGRLVRTEGPAEEGHALYIEMDGISFLKLVGDGTLRDFWMYDLERTPS